MSQCLFCRIIAGEIPATVLERTETTLAFRDVSPVSPTHVLVVPLEHLADLAEAMDRTPRIAEDLLAAGVRIARAEGLATGYRVVINTGPDAGQSVGHLHAHVLGGRHHDWPPG